MATYIDDACLPELGFFSLRNFNNSKISLVDSNKSRIRLSVEIKMRNWQTKVIRVKKWIYMCISRAYHAKKSLNVHFHVHSKGGYLYSLHDTWYTRIGCAVSGQVTWTVYVEIDIGSSPHLTFLVFIHF